MSSPRSTDSRAPAPSPSRHSVSTPRARRELSGFRPPARDVRAVMLRGGRRASRRPSPRRRRRRGSVRRRLRPRGARARRPPDHAEAGPPLGPARAGGGPPGDGPQPGLARQERRPLPGLLPARLRRLAEERGDPRRQGRVGPRPAAPAPHRRAAPDHARARPPSSPATIRCRRSSAPGTAPVWTSPASRRRASPRSSRSSPSWPGSRMKGRSHAAVIELHRRGIFPLFDIGSQQDFKDATLVIAGLDQDGLGLPDRDYYLEDDADSEGGARVLPRARAAHAGARRRQASRGAKRAAEDVLRIETAHRQARPGQGQRGAIRTRSTTSSIAGASTRRRAPSPGTTTSRPSASRRSGTSPSTASPTSPASTRSSATRSRRRGGATCGGTCSPRRRGAWARRSSTSASRCSRSSPGRRRSSRGGSAACSPTDRALGELLAQEYVRAAFDAASKRSAEEILQSRPRRDGGRARLAAVDGRWRPAPPRRTSSRR